ncbi:MAG TPA: J domain-containing protein [Pyrinomonadaceae bacterium]|nr:J domain-containing protein [Pyrinomonadaceae bacterium]
MSLDQSKAYELLGVKPGVSNRELKAAHRDLAKVWHPDRFLHDPRLQEKAQEKLKEINEAYELLISGKTPKPVTPPPSREPSIHHSKSRGVSWQWAAVLLVFAAVFAITTRTLLQRRNVPVTEDVPAASEQSVALDQEQRQRPDAIRKPGKPDQPSETTPSEVVTSEATPAPTVETVTVTIDPESGLLAKPDCRLRSRMTYTSGSQPTGYCNLSHTPPPKDSGLKKITKVFQ